MTRLCRAVDAYGETYTPELGFFERHADKVAFAGPDECWLWTAVTNGDGYGQVRARGKTRKAHRESYEDEHGIGSAAGLVVRHRCDTPACVNPAHLVIGTHADNNRDMMERGRHARATAHGEASGSAKLTEACVVAIRAEYIRGSSTHGLHALARKYGVCHGQIGRIVNRKKWAHV